ncbi:MAG: hypothetical protein FJW21_06365 [Acidimicrobiia bacterium]|nr:hypothetical protein [Acidimicrobiia bacterium]
MVTVAAGATALAMDAEENAAEGADVVGGVSAKAGTATPDSTAVSTAVTVRRRTCTRRLRSVIGMVLSQERH